MYNKALQTPIAVCCPIRRANKQSFLGKPVTLFRLDRQLFKFKKAIMSLTTLEMNSAKWWARPCSHIAILHCISFSETEGEII